MTQSTGRLAGRVAVVTGSARGIGRAIADRFAAEGARLVLADIDAAGAVTAAEEIEHSGGAALAVGADVGVAADVDRLFDQTLALTRGMALDLGSYGIRVCGLVPGLIATAPGHLTPEARQRRDATVPLGRGGVAADLAGPAVFLASDDAAYVTGSMLVVDGGVLVQQRSPQVETFPVSDFPAVADLG